MDVDSQFYAEDETGDVRVMGIGGPETSFALLNAKFDTYSYLISKYQCTKVLIVANTPGNNVDLRKIQGPTNIKNLSLHLNWKDCELYFSTETNAIFQKLVEFEFNGVFPKQFPSFKAMSSLKKLTVDFSAEHFDWSEHEGVIDLVVHQYKAENLRPLKKMTSLKRLCLAQSSLKTLDGIEDIPNLETVIVAGARNLTDLSALVKSHSLRNILFESYSKVKNWDFLVNMPQLKYLSLQEADSAEFISHLPNLVFFYCKKVGGKKVSTKEHLALQSELEQRLPLDQRGNNLPFYVPLVE